MLSTVHALETPGGDDDRQWLTYWVIIALLSALESFAAVLLTAARDREIWGDTGRYIGRYREI